MLLDRRLASESDAHHACLVVISCTSEIDNLDLGARKGAGQLRAHFIG
jgi:hypothetical protein